MYFGDHDPPHFHAEYAENRAVINIETLAILGGRLPPRALGLVAEWAALRQTNSGRLGRRRKNSNRRARSIHCPEPFRCHK